jgi:hypothetical protein
MHVDIFQSELFKEAKVQRLVGEGRSEPSNSG